MSYVVLHDATTPSAYYSCSAHLIFMPLLLASWCQLLYSRAPLWPVGAVHVYPQHYDCFNLVLFFALCPCSPTPHVYDPRYTGSNACLLHCHICSIWYLASSGAMERKRDYDENLEIGRTLINHIQQLRELFKLSKYSGSNLTLMRGNLVLEEWNRALESERVISSIKLQDLRDMNQDHEYLLGNKVLDRTRLSHRFSRKCSRELSGGKEM
ncbi:hypothetical protein Sjap_002449 [Stephania japonica]|uniref:Uncharacterized protein n=1 Tax=Stephania japonica TaxID=461633 RepID=A0AAP0KNN7_9MAGN